MHRKDNFDCWLFVRQIGVFSGRSGGKIRHKGTLVLLKMSPFFKKTKFTNNYHGNAWHERLFYHLWANFQNIQLFLICLPIVPFFTQIKNTLCWSCFSPCRHFCWYGLIHCWQLFLLPIHRADRGASFCRPKKADHAPMFSFLYVSTRSWHLEPAFQKCAHILRRFLRILFLRPVSRIRVNS